MMTTITTAPATPFGLAGLAPASPQSARGESVIVDGQRSELVAASQANAPLYDQKAHLTDTTVAARTAAVEVAARQGDMPRPAQDETRPAPPPNVSELPPNAELPPHMRVLPGEEARPENQEEQPQDQRKRRAMNAYAAPEGQDALPGDYFSMAV